MDRYSYAYTPVNNEATGYSGKYTMVSTCNTDNTPAINAGKNEGTWKKISDHLTLTLKPH